MKKSKALGVKQEPVVDCSHLYQTALTGKGTALFSDVPEDAFIMFKTEFNRVVIGVKHGLVVQKFFVIMDSSILDYKAHFGRIHVIGRDTPVVVIDDLKVSPVFNEKKLKHFAEKVEKKPTYPSRKLVRELKEQGYKSIKSFKKARKLPNRPLDIAFCQHGTTIYYHQGAYLLPNSVTWESANKANIVLPNAVKATVKEVDKKSFRSNKIWYKELAVA